jgi:hypothetical protein
MTKPQEPIKSLSVQALSAQAVEVLEEMLELQRKVLTVSSELTMLFRRLASHPDVAGSLCQPLDQAMSEIDGFADTAKDLHRRYRDARLAPPDGDGHAHAKEPRKPPGEPR